MKKLKIIGKNHLTPSSISFGGAPIGELFENLTEENCNKTLENNFKHGVKLFDTSPYYGLGLSETRLGNFLKNKERDSYLISTKVGRYLVPENPKKIDRGNWKGGLNFKPIIDYSYDGVMKSFEQSLNRLKIENIDIALIHDVDEFSHGDLAQKYFKTSMNGAYKALEKLKEEGLVKAIGVGLQDASMCMQFAKSGNFDCMLLANRYTLLEQKTALEFFPIANEKKISILLAGVYNSGILIKGLKKGITYEYSPINNSIKNKYLKLKKICDNFNIPVGAASLQFAYYPKEVSTLILGMDKPLHIEENLNLLNFKINPEFWSILKQKNIINIDCPTPS